MTATRKIDFINGAYSQMRISGLTVGPSSEDVETALARLENMMYLFCSRNLCTEYNFTENPDLNDFTNVPPVFNLMIESNLAVKLLADFGKEPTAALVNTANSTMVAGSGVSATALLQQVPYPQRMPRGSGTTQKISTFFNYQRNPPAPPVACSTHNIYIDDVNDYEESWTEYLGDGESISSYEISYDEGLFIESDSLTSPIVYFRVRGVSQQFSGNWQQVKIIVTTNLGRKNTRLVNFNVIKSNTVGDLN